MVTVWRGLEEVDVRQAVVVVGNFDGVHLGHQAVLDRARELADARRQPLVAVVFDPHPMAALRPQHPASLLTPIPLRIELLARFGVDAVLVLPFDLSTAAWSPAEFVDRVLVGSLGVSVVVVGASFRFGHRAAGDVAGLRRLGYAHGFGVESVPLAGGPQAWSSTFIRTCLAAGDVAGASQALGRHFAIRGTVVEGDRRGRTLGYPTANVQIAADAASPADGVYAGTLADLRAGVVWPAAISVGTNPTFRGERARRIESYVIDRDDLELYGAEVEVTIVACLRGMVAFEDVDELIRQMRVDVDQARALVGSSAPAAAQGGRSDHAERLGV